MILNRQVSKRFHKEMRGLKRCYEILLLLAISASASCAEPVKLKVTVSGLDKFGRLPVSAAYCVDPSIADSDHNISPAVSWSQGPKGTRSYVLIMTDLDVPRDLSLINKPGVTLGPETPRAPFIHWLLTDIPPHVHTLSKGADSPAFIPMGTPPGPTAHGIRGANVYSFFYPKNSPLYGVRGGYDGPCPPKNDQIAHRYVTEVYALDIPTLGLNGVFYGEQALGLMHGHILASGHANAIYGGSVK